jgi:hypothetical protein
MYKIVKLTETALAFRDFPIFARLN